MTIRRLSRATALLCTAAAVFTLGACTAERLANAPSSAGIADSAASAASAVAPAGGPASAPPAR